MEKKDLHLVVKNNIEIKEGDIILTSRGKAQVKWYPHYACYGLVGDIHYSMVPIVQIIMENGIEVLETWEKIGNIDDK